MSIEIHPRIKAIISEIEVLTEELSNLIYEYDLIRFTINKNILSKYVSLIGYLKIEQMELELDVKKMKRIISLIQSKINRNEIVNYDDIIVQVNNELNQWAEELKSYINSVRQAELNVFAMDNFRDSAEIKTLYRELVKKLHPDINPNLTAEQKLLWQRVQDCYINGNISELKTIELMFKAESIVYSEYSRIEDLDKIKTELNSNVIKYLEQIEITKNSHPYNLANKLDNPEYIESEKSKIQELIDILKENRKHYDSILNGMKGTIHVVLNLN